VREWVVRLTFQDFVIYRVEGTLDFFSAGPARKMEPEKDSVGPDLKTPTLFIYVVRSGIFILLLLGIMCII